MQCGNIALRTNMAEKLYTEYTCSKHMHNRQFSVFTTSVGLTQARPNEKSAIRLTSVGLTHGQPNIIHRPEEALDIQSELIFVNGMVHLPQE